MSDLSRQTTGSLRTWLQQWLHAWDSFWFTARAPHTLAVMRIACGAMLVYVHVIWACFLADFMGPQAWIDQDTIRSLHQNDWGWSWLFYTDSLPLVVRLELSRTDSRLENGPFGVPTGDAPPVDSDWFDAMDANRDGYLNRAEFLGSRPEFEEFDEDQDGFVSRREVASAL